MIYFDYNASAPILPEAAKAVNAAFAMPGNASAQHGFGRAARKLVEDAREKIAMAMGVCSQSLIFTGSGTESINTAIHSVVKSGCKKLYISAMDHPASILTADNSPAEITIIPALASGLLDLDWLQARLSRHDTGQYGRPFISVAIANSETGVIQNIERIIDMVRDVGGLLLLDAVQAFGKIPMEFACLADYIAVSAHKIGGPQGVGALYAAEGVPFFPLLLGGGQERRKRAGTLNVAGIAGFGAAAENMRDMFHTKAIRDRIEAGLDAMEAEIVFFGTGAERLPNTTLFAVPDKQSSVLMMALDLQGVCVSTGIACSSGKTGASRAVMAMGLADKAPKGVVRISLGEKSTMQDAEEFLQAWAKIRKIKNKGAA